MERKNTMSDYENSNSTNMNNETNYNSQMPPGNNYNVPPQQPPYYSTNYVQQPQVEQKASVGFAILSFLIPIAGLIIFLTQKSKKPKTAKVSGICALVSFILNIIISIIVIIITTISVTGTIAGTTYGFAEYLDDYSSSYSDNSYADDTLDYEDDNSAMDFVNEISVGDTYHLTVSDIPTGYTEDDLVWTSSDESIATVDELGNITGVAEGSVSIEVESSDGQYYDFYIIYVNE